MSESSQVLPVLPVRGSVFLPCDSPPLFIGREKSILAINKALNLDGLILMVTQKDTEKESPIEDDLYKFGVITKIEKTLNLPEKAVKVLVRIQSRAKVVSFIKESFEDDASPIEAEVELVKDITNEDDEYINNIEALKRNIIKAFDSYSRMYRKIPIDLIKNITSITDVGEFADSICSAIETSFEKKQHVLEELDLSNRLEKVYLILEEEIGVLSTENKIRNRVRSQMESAHRMYYLHEQLKAIQKEIGEEGSSSGFGYENSDISELEKKAKSIKLSKEAETKFKSEIKKLKNMSQVSAEASVIRGYLDWLIGMPWGVKSKIKNNLTKASEILNENHYGMEKVKERIIEYLAVNKKTKSIAGPILCVVGPPGVGKTSLAESVAEATGRKYSRISLGGLKDESEIKGHRRTYVGSMPGKIIQAIKNIKTDNSLILLDEIDKMSCDFRGDPASTLLEVLDPDHNKKFVDHYMEVEYDISDVMFIATANSLNIPIPLLDRMELIKINGYTEEEKIKIATKHLLPKTSKEHGLREDEISISQQAIVDLIRYYTFESGVRNLKKELSNLMRKSVRAIVVGNKTNVSINSKNLKSFSGVRRYKYGIKGEKDVIGVSTGLAYTDNGGDLLYIESVKVPGKGEIKSTGQLGDVMKESVQASFSYIMSKYSEYKIDQEDLKNHDIHIHAPEGAIPKDGPSAGVAICVAITSLLTGRYVKSEVAMTGEMSLRGKVLAIGGLKEKLLAAVRGGIKTVLIPKENEKDMQDIPKSITKNLKIVFMETLDEALNNALSKKVKKRVSLK